MFFKEPFTITVVIGILEAIVDETFLRVGTCLTGKRAQSVLDMKSDSSPAYLR